MTITVSSGVTSSGLSISTGDPLVVLSGGEVESSTILSGGSATLSAGAIGNDLTVSKGGVLLGAGILEGGLDFDIDIAGSVSGVTIEDVEAFLLNGGVASGVTLANFGLLQVDAGATATGTIVDNSDILVAGSTADTLVGSGGTEVVDSGGVASGGSVRSGGELVLLVGTVIDQTVSSGASFDFEGSLTSSFTVTGAPVTSTTTLAGVTALSGATVDVDGATIQSGATLSLAAGVTETAEAVAKGGTLLGPGALTFGVSDAGLISGVTIEHADVGDDVLSGGTASAVTLTEARLTIDTGGTVVGAVVLEGSFLMVDGSDTGARIGSGGTEIVDAGGMASDDTVQSGGQLVVSSGGTASETILSGGTLNLLALTSGLTVVAGTVTSTTVLAGVTLSSGAHETLEGVSVQSGATLSLTTGASADSVTVDRGGVVLGPGELTGSSFVFGSVGGVAVGAPGAVAEPFLEIMSGGTASGVSVGGGGDLQVDSGASVAATVIGAGGFEGVVSGGVASGDIVASGGTLDVDGATLVGDTVRSGGTLQFDGNIANSITVGLVTSTTVLSGVTLSSGADLTLVDVVTVLSGATVSLASHPFDGDLTVSKGATVLGPGALEGFTTDAGAISGVSVDLSLEILSGGTASGVIAAAGEVLIDSGGTATGTVVSAGVDVDVHGSTDGTQVESGGEEVILSGGLASADAVRSGGIEFVSSGGVASATTVLSGGRAYVYTGAVASGTTLSNGGKEAISSGGSGVDVTVSAGGALYLLASGTTTGTVLSGDGKELVSSGGVAGETQVRSGGLQYVYAGGLASGGQVSNGGKELVSSGGVAEGTQVLSGGLQYVYSGGEAEGPSVAGGGVEVISAGGTAVGLSLGSGGEVIDEGEVRIAGAGTLAGILLGSGAVIETGGGDLVLSSFGDRDFAGKAVIEGGTIELASAGALGSGTVQFVEPTTGSAVLQIDAADAPAAGGTFANTIVDFSGANEDIDLRSIAFVSGASATVSDGVLVLTDGGKTYSFNVAGTTAGLYPVLSDGHGGTLIDPQALALTHAMAAFATPGAASAAPISRTSSSAETPFLHATASAGAGHA